MSSQFDAKGVILIKQEGCFYSVYNNDALIFNKYLGYKLYGKKKIKTGFHINKLDIVLEKIDKIGIDYDIIDKQGNIIASKRFPFGVYEVIDPALYKESNNENKGTKRSIRGITGRLELYINVLDGVCKGCNPFTGELIFGMDKELLDTFYNMMQYFLDRLGINVKRINENKNHNKKWTKFDDEKLLKEYKSGKSINELRKMFSRSSGAIKARLINLLNIH